MTKPWATSRMRLKEEKELFGNLSLSGIRTKNLLTDADALLLMKEPLREIAFAPLDVHPADDELAFYKRELKRCITIAAKALAALPENLKGDQRD